MSKYDGLFPALLTPFNADMSVNTQALRRLVRLNLDKGADGFYVCGSTAEAFMLTLEQRKRILEIVSEENDGQALIYVHAGCISQNQAMELAIHARQNGADVVSAVTPFYYGFSFEEIRDYYMALADAACLPVLIYNFPDNSGVRLTIEQFAQLLRDDRFLGVKHTCQDLFQIERFHNIKPDAAVYNGFDEMFLGGVAMGANGGIGSTYNFMLEKFQKIMILYKAGDVSEALAVQSQANDIISALRQVGILPGEKYALELMGIDMGECLRPFKPLDAHQRDMLKTALKRNGCLPADA